MCPSLCQMNTKVNPTQRYYKVHENFHSQLFSEFPMFCGIWRFIAYLTRVNQEPIPTPHPIHTLHAFLFSSFVLDAKPIPPPLEPPQHEVFSDLQLPRPSSFRGSPQFPVSHASTPFSLLNSTDQVSYQYKTTVKTIASELRDKT